MGKRYVPTLFWLAFALIGFIGATRLLAACDTGLPFAILGGHYCTTDVVDPLAVEREREKALRAAIYQSEMRIATKPPCITCLPLAEPKANVAVVIDLSPSMHTPAMLTPQEAGPIKMAETLPDPPQEALDLQNKLMEQDHGRRSRFDVVRNELPKSLSELGERPVVVVTFRACNEIEASETSMSALPGIVANLRAPNRPSGNIGGTPIAESLRIAAEKLQPDASGKYSGTLLLVTDGNDSCQGDYCSVARRIAETKPGLKINVVDLTGYTDIGCVASATGGQVFRRAGEDSIAGLLRQAQAPITPVCFPSPGKPSLPPASK